MRKIIQISCCSHAMSGEERGDPPCVDMYTIVALCDDGSVWIKERIGNVWDAWYELSSIDEDCRIPQRGG
jgi:hypothetical protein